MWRRRDNFCILLHGSFYVVLNEGLFEGLGEISLGFQKGSKPWVRRWTVIALDYLLANLNLSGTSGASNILHYSSR